MSDTTATSFDAIKTSNELQAEGIEPGQANAIEQGMTQASAAAVDAITAFRAEMRSGFVSIDAKIEKVDAKIDTSIAQMQVRLTTTLITAMGVFSAITIAAVRYM